MDTKIVTFKYSTESIMETAIKLNLIIVGYIAAICREFSNSFPSDIIQLLISYNDIDIIMNQISIENQFQIKSIFSTESNQYYSQCSKLSLSSKKYGYPQDLQFNLISEIFTGNAPELSLTFQRQNLAHFAAYVDIYCDESNNSFALNSSLSFINIDSSATYYCTCNEETINLKNLTYKCYFDLIPYNYIPVFDDKIEYLWNIDRNLLKDLGKYEELTSPVLQIYHGDGYGGKQEQRYYFIKMSRYCIRLCWGHDDRHLFDNKGRISYRYWMQMDFDEMKTKWSGYEFTYTGECLYIYPSKAMQYFDGWLKRFIPTIKCIRLQFQRCVR